MTKLIEFNQRKLYCVQSSQRFTPCLFVKAYSGQQAVLIANKTLPRNTWIKSKQVTLIPKYANYISKTGKVKQNFV